MTSVVERVGGRADRSVTTPRERVAFHASVLVAGIGFGLTAPFTALLVTSLGGTPTEAAAVVSSMGLSLLLVDLFGSRAIPRLGSRWTLSGSSLVFAVGSAASVVTDSWHVVAAGRVLQGFGVALFMGGGIHLALRLSEEKRRASAVGAFNAAWFAGIAVGPLGGGLVAATIAGVDGLRLLFGVCAAVGVVAAALGWWLAPRVPVAGTLRPSLPRDLRLGSARLRCVMVLAGVGQAVRTGVAMTLLPLLGEQVGMSSVTLGAALFALAVTDVGCMVLGSRWTERHGRRPLLLSGLALGVVVTAALAVATLSPFVLAGCALVLGITVGTTWTLPASMAIDIAPDPAAAVGAYRISSDVGMLAGGALAALALAAGGLVAAFLGAAAVMAGALVLTLVVGETRARPTEQTPVLPLT